MIDTAEQAVDAKYAPYREQNELFKAQLEAIAPLLSKHEKQLLFEVINQRYEKMHCTIVVSKANTLMLSKQIGVSTVDRLTENSIALAFDWDSYRKYLGEKK